MQTGSLQRLKLFYMICIAVMSLFLIWLFRYASENEPHIWNRNRESRRPMREAATYASAIPRTSSLQITQRRSASPLSATKVASPPQAQVTPLKDISRPSLTPESGKTRASFERGTQATKAQPRANLRFDNVSGRLITNLKLTGLGKYKTTARVVTSASARNKTTATALVAAISNEQITNLSVQFKPLMSLNERMAFMRTLSTLADSLQNAGVTYFLYGGTLLGAYRHRGMIPWDDDMDIIANCSQEPELRRALEMVPGYILNIWSKWRYKFYAVDALTIPGRKWQWPFIDIFFFNETSTRVFDFAPASRDRYSYLKEDVFPLVYRPFDGLWLPVPAHEQKIVNKDYGLKYCQSNTYSHRYEGPIPKASVHSVPCEYLYKIHPFAFRNSTVLPVKETVKIGDTIIAEYILSH